MRGPTQIARMLRRRLTPAEQTVWRWLRHRYLGGFKFRRQHPINRYVLDFYCAELKLAIELDGSGHDGWIQQGYDERRSRELSTAGIQLVRLRNEVILENADGAWEMIALAVARSEARRRGISSEVVLSSLIGPDND